MSEKKQTYLRIEKFNDYHFGQVALPSIEKKMLIEKAAEALLTDATDDVDDYLFQFGKGKHESPITVVGTDKRLVYILTRAMHRLLGGSSEMFDESDKWYKTYHAKKIVFADYKRDKSGLVLEVLGNIPTDDLIPRDEPIVFCVAYDRFHASYGSVIFKIPKEDIVDE